MTGSRDLQDRSHSYDFTMSAALKGPLDLPQAHVEFDLETIERGVRPPPSHQDSESQLLQQCNTSEFVCAQGLVGSSATATGSQTVRSSSGASRRLSLSFGSRGKHSDVSPNESLSGKYRTREVAKKWAFAILVALVGTGACMAVLSVGINGTTKTTLAEFHGNARIIEGDFLDRLNLLESIGSLLHGACEDANNSFDCDE